ncbi:MAG: lamin tail domain-containing protein [Candidatus Marinimicrobia bacterium]|nr:lamin tail domain-containing protein [Candidatus Neomarinimicrobiota bacterium]
MKYFFTSFFFFYSQSFAQILFTEILYDLPGSDSPNEFVEIFNPSLTDTVHLDGWTIVDRLYTDTLEDSGDGLSIPPNGYGLIMEGDYDITNGIYQNIIPENTIIIKVDDSSIGNGLSGFDSLFLYDSSGLLIDFLGWEDIVTDGYSLEKVRPLHPNEPYNWIAGIDSLGTPGMKNSVYPFEIDGSIVENSISIHPSVIQRGETTTIMGEIVNIGFQSFGGQIHILENDEIIALEYLSPLSELDTTEFELEIGPFSSGAHTFSVTLILDNDLNLLNNDDSISLGVRYETSVIRINEFYPQPTSEEPEFVELIYFGDEDLNLAGWRVTDNSNGLNYIWPNIVVVPNEYFIIADDSSFFDIVPENTLYIVPSGGFPSLNNSSDIIRLFDPFDSLIDSISYQSSWGYSSGVSSEKIFPESNSNQVENWQHNISELGKSPGQINSVTPSEVNGTLINNIYTSPSFPSENESFLINVPVVNSGVNIFSGSVQIEHNDVNLSVSNFVSGALAETTMVSLPMPGFESGIHTLEISLIISEDSNLNDNTIIDTLLVRYGFNDISINEFMALPNNDQAEFVEIISNRDMEMTGWKFSDNRKNLSVLQNIIVQEDEFIVIASDSLIFDFVHPEAHTIVLQNQFPSLNNSGDAIYIYDMTGAIVDSLIYNEDWPLESEISTEKLRPEFESNLENNWTLADPIIGSTPGNENSKILKNIDGSIIQSFVTHAPEFPELSDSIQINISIYNAGVSPFSGSYYVEENDDELIENSFSIIDPGDTLNTPFMIMPLSSGIHFIQIYLDIPGDSQPNNDYGADTIFVSFPFGSVKINEFMSLTDSNHFEFVELVSMGLINIDNWGLTDLSGRIMTFSEFELHQGSYFTISGDSALLEIISDTSLLEVSENMFPNLNNSSDGIYILDMTGKVIDSLLYDEDWPIIENRSTEKFQSNYESNSMKNWGIAVNELGSTPGGTNSLAFDTLPIEGSVYISPNPFSPDGDGYDDQLKIEYSFPFENSTLRMEIFDMVGRTIAQPFYNLNVGQNGVLYWDGQRSSGQPARIGIYIIKTTAKDHASGKEWEDLQTVVLAKKL